MPETDAAASVSDAADSASADVVDALIIGGGPAGLSAALNLGRARASVVVVDADRPRNAATLRSHGFLTRDGMPPHELRKIARTELEAYPSVRVLGRTRVTSLRGVAPVGAVGVGSAGDAGVTGVGGAEAGVSAAGVSAAGVSAAGVRFVAVLEGRGAPTVVRARSVLVATGLRETLPDVPGIRGFYGMTVFSCAACDAWELQDKPLALFGETPDLASRARLIARWTHALTVFTNGADVIDTVEEAELAVAGVRVERRPVAALEGEKGRLEAVRLDDDSLVPVEGGFVRPLWHPSLELLADVDVDRDAEGHLIVDRSGRTSIAGLYGAGDAAAPGPQQLIVAAGQGARVAAVLVHDLIGVTTAH